MKAKLKTHPMAEKFPRISEEELGELCEDIRKHGQLEPIETFEGAIIDGRNRLRACEAIGIEPKIVEWQGDPATLDAYIISKNLVRRHLSPSVRAALAAEELEKYKTEASSRKGGRPRLHGKPTQFVGEVSRTGEAVELAAQDFQVNPEYVRQAEKLKGNPEIRALVLDGLLTVRQGVKIHNCGAAKQREMIDRLRAGEPVKEVLKLAKEPKGLVQILPDKTAFKTLVILPGATVDYEALLDFQIADQFPANATLFIPVTLDSLHARKAFAKAAGFIETHLITFVNLQPAELFGKVHENCSYFLLALKNEGALREVPFTGVAKTSDKERDPVAVLAEYTELFFEGPYASFGGPSGREGWFRCVMPALENEEGEHEE